jgi:FAD/FMN-containing dehydrogenase
MESEPRVVAAEGEAVHEILHAWGTNGIIVRIRLALTPAVEWSQCLIAFGSFAEAFDFSEGVANHTSWIKRLVSVFESPISSFFTPIRRYAPPEKALALIYIARAQAEALSQAALRLGGELCYLDSYRGVRTQPLLSDYSWNHTTLWALKADPAYTYLQCAFDPLMVRQQMQRLKQHFGSEILFHMEFIKNGAGVIVPGALPLVHYRSEERLGEMIELCRDLGVAVANPHVNNVEGGGRYRADNIQLLAKQRYDPKGLLNPGKMASFRPSAATRGERTA